MASCCAEILDRNPKCSRVTTMVGLCMLGQALSGLLHNHEFRQSNIKVVKGDRL